MSTPAKQKYLDPEESQNELLSHLDPATRREWDSYGNLRREPAFQDRVFVVYECLGRNNQNVLRPPKILTKLRVMSFIARDELGSIIRFLDDKTNTVLEVGHIPKKVFDYPLFLQVPFESTLKYDAHYHGGAMERTLSYVVLVKARNKASFYSKGNVYLEAPNNLKDLYSHLDLKLEI